MSEGGGGGMDEGKQQQLPPSYRPPRPYVNRGKGVQNMGYMRPPRPYGSYYQQQSHQESPAPHQRLFSVSEAPSSRAGSMSGEGYVMQPNSAYQPTHHYSGRGYGHQQQWFSGCQSNNYPEYRRRERSPSAIPPTANAQPRRPAVHESTAFTEMTGLNMVATESVAVPRDPIPESGGGDPSKPPVAHKTTSFRRRDWNVTYSGNRMKDVVHNMTDPHSKFKYLLAYAIFQLEIGTTTGRPFKHWQCYVEFHGPQYVSLIKEMFCDSEEDAKQTPGEPRTTHIEIRLRSREASRNYCKKLYTRAPGPQSEVGPFEIGKWREQGNASAMKQIREAIVDGQSIADIAEDFPDQVFKHRNNLEWYYEQQKTAKAMDANREITVRLFVGATGTGKTHMAQQEALVYAKGDFQHVYILDSGGKMDATWFDGYKNGPVLIIDDFDSWIQPTYLLRLLDKYPCRLPVKGSTKWASWTEVWITSNKQMHEWYGNGSQIDIKHVQALERRIHWIALFEERGKYIMLKAPYKPVNFDLPTVSEKALQERSTPLSIAEPAEVVELVGETDIVGTVVPEPSPAPVPEDK